jgi:hypothetical protein
MHNINPLFLLQPVLTIAIASALMLYWYKKQHFHGTVWLYSLAAYGIAIALKYAVQLPTINFVIDTFGANSVGLGIYYGVQTVVFEVGLAFTVAYFAIKHSKLDRRDAEAYGSGLAFWENVGFLSILSLINLVAYYVILSGSGSIADLTYSQLSINAPDLFSSNLQALGLVGIGVLERTSSLMIHVAWGYLCFMAVLYHRKRLFAIALPMGLVDFLVPFAQNNVLLFEAVVFALAVLSVLVAWYATKDLGKDAKASPTAPPPPLTVQQINN